MLKLIRITSHTRPRILEHALEIDLILVGAIILTFRLGACRFEDDWSGTHLDRDNEKGLLNEKNKDRTFRCLKEKERENYQDTSANELPHKA
jgi:hypothetical protein